MKKIYIIPKMEAVYTAQTLLQTVSDPDVGIGDGSVDAGDVEVKGNKNYDVWDDDWSR